MVSIFYGRAGKGISILDLYHRPANYIKIQIGKFGFHFVGSTIVSTMVRNEMLYVAPNCNRTDEPFGYLRSRNTAKLTARYSMRALSQAFSAVVEISNQYPSSLFWVTMCISTSIRPTYKASVLISSIFWSIHLNGPITNGISTLFKSIQDLGSLIIRYVQALGFALNKLLIIHTAMHVNHEQMIIDGFW